MSHEKRAPGCLGYIGDYAAQLCRDLNKHIERSLLNNQYFMERRRVFLVAQMDLFWVLSF